MPASTQILRNARKQRDQRAGISALECLSASKEQVSPFEMATVRVGTSGKISVYTGAAPMGQSTHHDGANWQSILGDLDNIEVIAGDTQSIPMGMGVLGVVRPSQDLQHISLLKKSEKVLTVAANYLSIRTRS